MLVSAWLLLLSVVVTIMSSISESIADPRIHKEGSRRLDEVLEQCNVDFSSYSCKLM
jgi:hypothetical protein